MVCIRSILAFSFVFSANCALPAFSCEKYIDIPDDQVREIDKQVREAKPLDLDAVLNYGKLICADRAAIRDHARRIGLESSNETIRAQALLAALLEKETITLETYLHKEMSDEQREFVKNNPYLSYAVTHRDKEKACLSLGESNRCNPSYSVSIEGDGFTLRSNYHIATLRLSDKNTLTGRWSNTAQLSKDREIPVRMYLH